MSKRYGRNQRRAHRERIAQLEAQVHRLSSTGPGGWRWAPAEQGVFTLLEQNVARSRDETVEGEHERTRREVSVDVYLEEAEAYSIRESGRVNWRGICWRVGNMEAIRGGPPRKGLIITLHMEAVAPRDWTPADLPEHRR